MMILKNYHKELISLIATFCIVILLSLIWENIKFNFENPNEIIGYYSIFKHSYLNDNIRYILFISLPLIVYLISKIFFYKIKISSLKTIFRLESYNNEYNKLNSKYLLYFFFLLIYFFLTQKFNYNFIDLFHEGQALSGALNYKINQKLWSSSFIVTSLFVDILNANIAWSLTGVESISSYRLFIKVLTFITAFISFIFVLLIINILNLDKNLKKILYIFFCIFLFSLFDNQTLGYRELPVFIFLIFTFLIIVKQKTNIIILSILGFLPLISLLWSLDRGIFLLASYLPFYIVLILNKKLKELLLISFFGIFSLLFFISIIGKIEFFYFIDNSLNILSSSDLLNGIIHPTPFSNDANSSRASKSLLIILLNGIILVNYLLRENSNIKKNFRIYLVLYYFLALIFYKIGITRSDGGHIKQGVSLNLILLTYLVIINIFIFFEKKKYFFFNNKFLLNIFVLIFLTTFCINNTPKKFISNLLNFKERLINYIHVSDIKFLKNNEQLLIEELKILMKDEECIQLFSYETAISYLLKTILLKILSYYEYGAQTKSNDFY